MITKEDFTKISDYIWEVPKKYREDMRVPARVYVTESMLEDILDEKAIEQLINIATLPGIEKYALAMPDIHQGYGFPIGGVAAFRTSDGIISPGGVGYDINCGVRLLTSSYSAKELGQELLVKLANQIQRDVPSGVGRGGRFSFKTKDLDDVLNKGVKWALENGYALNEDLEVLEEQGSYPGADASFVSDKAKKRGHDQLGTLGAGNHFLEVQEVVEIFDNESAKAYGLSEGQLVVMIHTGSRGLGHQVCTEYVSKMDQAMEKYNIQLPDRELACAPFESPEGQAYFKAMAASANYAWTNRQLIAYSVRGAFKQVMKQGEKKDHLTIVYDIAHNIAKKEVHDGIEYIVHRKGATRSFGPAHPEIPTKYKDIGQPVLIPGSMGTYSYVLAGTKESMEETFGSSCHGAGRELSRSKARKTLDYNKLKKDLDEYGVVVRAGSAKGLLEEAPEAYKDIDEVVNVVHNAKIAKKVAKLKPLAVVKG